MASVPVGQWAGSVLAGWWWQPGGLWSGRPVKQIGLWGRGLEDLWASGLVGSGPVGRWPGGLVSVAWWACVMEDCHAGWPAGSNPAGLWSRWACGACGEETWQGSGMAGQCVAVWRPVNQQPGSPVGLRGRGLMVQ
jgi:hypothetical protein